VRDQLERRRNTLTRLNHCWKHEGVYTKKRLYFTTTRLLDRGIWSVHLEHLAQLFWCPSAFSSAISFWLKFGCKQIIINTNTYQFSHRINSSSSRVEINASEAFRGQKSNTTLFEQVESRFLRWWSKSSKRSKLNIEQESFDSTLWRNA
jgi:hypothetical protein